MGVVKDNLGAFIKLVLALLVVGWYWGAHRQAADRSCIELKASERTFNGGFIDSIARGWDWPIYWLNGTTPERIPCKNGGQFVE